MPGDLMTAPRLTNVVALVKAGERYVYLFDNDSAGEVLRLFGRNAADETLTFDWTDSALLSRAVHRMLAEVPSAS